MLVVKSLLLCDVYVEGLLVGSIVWLEIDCYKVEVMGVGFICISDMLLVVLGL